MYFPSLNKATNYEINSQHYPVPLCKLVEVLSNTYTNFFFTWPLAVDHFVQ